MITETRTVTPQKAIEILKQHGIIVTIEEAKLILNFMYKVAGISVKTYIKL